jgi:hypothetical protein
LRRQNQRFGLAFNKKKIQWAYRCRYWNGYGGSPINQAAE